MLWDDWWSNGSDASDLVLLSEGLRHSGFFITPSVCLRDPRLPEVFIKRKVCLAHQPPADWLSGGPAGQPDCQLKNLPAPPGPKPETVLFILADTIWITWQTPLSLTGLKSV